MQRSSVASSNLAAIGYDPLNHILEVEFRNGSVYAYKDVPREVASAFDQAESKGSFLDKEIKGTFAYAQIMGPRVLAPAKETRPDNKMRPQPSLHDEQNRFLAVFAPRSIG